MDAAALVAHTRQKHIELLSLHDRSGFRVKAREHRERVMRNPLCRCGARRWRWLAALASVACAAGLVAAAPSTAASAAASARCSAGTTVRTADGSICGTTAAGITTYVGVPYAAPPVGRLRWAPPQPVKPWTSTLKAVTTPPECPSPGFGSPPTVTGDENCLYLKIEVPAGVKAGARLPVMYEIHGGGFIGEANTSDGNNFVKVDNAVYVFVQYRLGILGFLADKALGPHSGDYGLQDQQAGLRWVRRNIAAFGGNPRNVTIFGESAGGASVCDQVASPTARSLFQRGISISGFYNYQDNIVWPKADCKSSYFTEAQAQAVGAKFAAKVGCGGSAHVAACLRAVPVAKLVEDAGTYENPTAGGTIGPIVNGTTLKMSPARAFATGQVNRVPLIIDVGADEFNGGVYSNSPGGRVVVADTPAQYRLLVREQFGRYAPRVERMYPLDEFISPFTAYRTIMADSASVCPALRADKELSRYLPLYADIDEDASNPTDAFGSTEPLGALHSGTDGLAHDTAALSPDQAALRSQILAEEGHFNITNNPSAPNTPRWLPYRDGQLVMALRPASTSGLVPASVIASEHNCGFWNSITHY